MLLNGLACLLALKNPARLLGYDLFASYDVVSRMMVNCRGMLSWRPLDASFLLDQDKLSSHQNWASVVICYFREARMTTVLRFDLCCGSLSDVSICSSQVRSGGLVA